MHIIACDPACNDGLMRCTGTGSNDCCAAFEDGNCINSTTGCSQDNFVANSQNNFFCSEPLHSFSSFIDYAF